MGHFSPIFQDFKTRNSNWKDWYFLFKGDVSWCLAPKVLCNPLPSAEELSESDLEALSQIIIKHEHGGAIYISKATIKEDLRLADISSVEHRPSPPSVITLSSFLLRALVMHFLVILNKSAIFRAQVI